MEANELRGVSPDGWAAGARWKGEADIPDTVLFGAAEALMGDPDPGVTVSAPGSSP